MFFLTDAWSPDDPAVDVVVVGSALVAGVVRRVDVDALDLAGVIGQQRLERDQVVALDDEVAGARVAAGEFRHVFQQMKGHFQVVVHHRLFPDPVQRRHNQCAPCGASRSEHVFSKAIFSQRHGDTEK